MSQMKNPFGVNYFWTYAKSKLGQWWDRKTSWDTEKTVRYSRISHHLIHEIPLFRFILKIADAYPNADRNLNLEAFDNKILNQEMTQKWMIFSEFAKENTAI